MDPQQRETVEAIARILGNSQSVLFVTGAGVSADSGVPTYRGVGGLYDVELTEEGLPIEEVLSGYTMRADPELTWKYLAQIADACRGATFNRAHEVIAQLEERIPRIWTLTQNVDGFHVAAGSTNVIEVHGHMRELYCTACGDREAITRDSQRQLPPYCSKCDAIMRPDVVLFDEMLPGGALETLNHEFEKGFDAVLAIGTTGSFPYIRAPFEMRDRLKTVAIEINPDATVLTPKMDYHLPMRAAEAMGAIWGCV